MFRWKKKGTMTTGSQWYFVDAGRCVQGVQGASGTLGPFLGGLWETPRYARRESKLGREVRVFVKIIAALLFCGGHMCTDLDFLHRWSTPRKLDSPRLSWMHRRSMIPCPLFTLYLSKCATPVALHSHAARGNTAPRKSSTAGIYDTTLQRH